MQDDNTGVNRLLNKAFAHFLKKTTIATTGGSEFEVNKYVGPVSKIMIVLTSKDGNFSSYFDKIREDSNNNTTMKEIPIGEHTFQTNEGKVFGRLALQHIFGFFNTFRKVTKNLSSHITSKANDLKVFLSSNLPEAAFINVKFDNLYLFVPKLVPSRHIEIFFNESIKKFHSII